LGAYDRALHDSAAWINNGTANAAGDLLRRRLHTNQRNE
jgi:hypothetical protein